MEGAPKVGQKRKGHGHRLRAHSNPLSDHDIFYPLSPAVMDWSEFYPALTSEELTNMRVRIADVGCGFGGLTVNLSALFPEKMILGMEIRDRVVDYVQKRIAKLRKDNPGQYKNIACARVNAMKHLPNWFEKGQLDKIFFLFPDPHFKKANFRRRIISPTLLAEYAYVLRVGGLIYTNTDVEDLHLWMVEHLSAHPLFERVPAEELESDPVMPHIMESSEEGKKVTKNQGKKFPAVFRRINA